ncbi:TPA: BPSL0761 family protein [Pseudomonas aeruginosa]
MTMPSERTRSIIQAREFLVDLSRDKTLPETVRIEARRLLRHYPTADEVLLAGKIEEQRDDGLPWFFLSSRID